MLVSTFKGNIQKPRRQKRVYPVAEPKILLELLFARHHVDDRILEQSSEHKYQTRGHPHVNGLYIGHLGQLTSNTFLTIKQQKKETYEYFLRR